jgi:hypothetical protein
MALTQALLKDLSLQRLEEARVLYQERKYSGSYYLAGYVIELSLKAIIAKNFNRNTIPDKSFVMDIYKHDFKTLMGLAGLNLPLTSEMKARKPFAANWGIVSQWSPEHRYTKKTKAEAGQILEAIANETDGVLPWIKSHW